MDWSLCFILTCLLIFRGEAEKYCKTPKNETGVCTKLTHCPTLKSIIRKDITQEEKALLRQSYCELDSNNLIPQVCCHPIDFCIENCGWFSSDQFGAYMNPPNIDDFSWLVLIQEETKKHTNDFICSGTLISELYTITAASCFETSTTQNEDSKKLYSIRLGDIDLKTKPDCINGDCLDPEFNSPVSEIIKHNTMDIALAKLSVKLFFERAISPICLFDKSFSKSGRSKFEVVGFQNLKRQKSMVDADESCGSPGIICVRKACASNHGGPLMKLVYHNKYHSRYTLIGVQSQGNCTQMIFTNVEPLLSWIRQKIMPY